MSCEHCAQPLPKLVTAAVLAEVLNVSLKRVYQLKRSGGIPYYQTGTRGIRFSIEEVLESMRQTASARTPTENETDADSTIRSLAHQYLLHPSRDGEEDALPAHDWSQGCPGEPKEGS